MSAPAAFPWIQYSEDVVAENEPNGHDDVANRPTKFIVTQSDFAITDPFPGFMARWTGIASPEGVIEAPAGHAFVNTSAQSFYVKMTPAGNTGWVAIGGNLSGLGSPEGVVTADIGKLYEQRDAGASANALWIKATGAGNTGWRQSVGFRKEVDNAVVMTGTTGTFSAVVTDSILIGNGGTISAINTVAIGKAASASGTNSIAIGNTAPAPNADDISIGRAIVRSSAQFSTPSIAIGGTSEVSATGGVGVGGIAIGFGAIIRGTAGGAARCVVIGQASTAIAASFSDVVIVGGGTTTTGSGGTYIGAGITGGAGNGNVVIGGTASTSVGSSGVIIGTGASSAQNNNVVIGAAATCGSNQGCVVVGQNITSNGGGAIAIGQGCIVSSGATSGGIVIGVGSTTAAQGCIVIGRTNAALSTNTSGIYIGDAITITAASAAGQINIGKGITTGVVANNVTIGTSASQLGGAAGAGGVCIGFSANYLGNAGGGVVIGPNATSNSTSAGPVAIGSSASANGSTGPIAIGNSAVAGGAGSISIGSGATCDSSNSIAIGNSAVTTGFAGSYALGLSATAIVANEFVVGSNTTRISQFRFNADTSTTPAAMTMRLNNASGSNISGVDWTFLASRNTGSGNSGSFIFQTSATNGTAAVLGALSTIFIINRTVAIGTAVQANAVFAITTGVTAATALGRIVNVAATVTAAANNDVLAGIVIAPTFTVGGLTGTIGIGLDIAAITGAATNYAIRSATSRCLFGTTTASTFNTAGIVINQGGADDEILSLKSSDVAHGMTTLADTDSFCTLTKRIAAGGLTMQGLQGSGADTLAFLFAGRSTVADTSKSTGSRGCIAFDGSLKSGTTVGSLGANADICSFSDAGTTRFILDADGDSHQDVGTAWTNFDDHDDVALLNKLSAHVTKIDDPLRASFGKFLVESREELERLKLVTFNPDGHHFVNMSRLTMLHTGAIRQLGERFDRIEAALNRLLPAGV